jgi:hypothetical protein
VQFCNFKHFISGPLAFHSHDIGLGKNVTSHPAVKNDMEKDSKFWSRFLKGTGRIHGWCYQQHSGLPSETSRVL